MIIKTDWSEDSGVDYKTLNRIEGNIGVLNSHSNYFTATGTTAIVVDTLGYFTGDTGQSFTFVAGGNNGGSPTTLNAGTGAKNLYKPNTATAPSITAGKAYSVWYNGTSFFVNASAEGNAGAENVLTGKTFSNDDDTGIAGTMPNRGDASADITAKGQEVSIQAGYHNGSGKVKISTTEQAKIIPANIKDGVTVLGQTGVYQSFTNSSDVQAGYCFVAVDKRTFTVTVPNDFQKVSEIEIKKKGTYLVMFELLWVTPGMMEYTGEVRRNGSTVGISGVSYTAQETTVQGTVSANIGDLIQLYAKYTNTEGWPNQQPARNFMVGIKPIADTDFIAEVK